MAAKRFVIDSQTFTQAMWFIIPGGMAYAYAHFATEDEETKEKHLNENYIATTKSARKGSTALGPIRHRGHHLTFIFLCISIESKYV